jgi:tRNA-specific 2-thiouridylase
LFPLFEISEKEETRDIARKLNLFVAEKKDSQEICFINDSYREFLKDKIESKKTIGNFVDLEGNILGKHEGIWNYTIGQRKGLNIAFGKPMYVVSIDSDSKNVVLGSNEDLYVSSLTASSINWIFEDAYKRNEDVDIKIRYNGSSVKGRFELIDEKVNVTFYEPVRAVTSGQSVVFYKDNILLGGGII